MPSSQSNQSVIDQFQVPDILEVLRQFRKDAEALDLLMNELITDFPNQWAGMYMGDLTVAPTLVGLLELLGGEENVVIRLLDPNPLPLILAYV